jgi:hypothetical protein
VWYVKPNVAHAPDQKQHDFLRCLDDVH